MSTFTNVREKKMKMKLKAVHTGKYLLQVATVAYTSVNFSPYFHCVHDNDNPQLPIASVMAWIYIRTLCYWSCMPLVHLLGLSLEPSWCILLSLYKVHFMMFRCLQNKAQTYSVSFKAFPQQNFYSFMLYLSIFICTLCSAKVKYLGPCMLF